MRRVRIFYFMNLTQLLKGESAEIVSVSCEKELKERLFSLGIRPKQTLRLVKISKFRKTYLVLAAGNQIALCREVAQCVTLHK